MTANTCRSVPSWHINRPTVSATAPPTRSGSTMAPAGSPTAPPRCCRDCCWRWFSVPQQHCGPARPQSCSRCCGPSWRCCRHTVSSRDWIRSRKRPSIPRGSGRALRSARPLRTRQRCGRASARCWPRHCSWCSARYVGGARASGPIPPHYGARPACAPRQSRRATNAYTARRWQSRWHCR